jgi:hypothetical protein
MTTAEGPDREALRERLRRALQQAWMDSTGPWDKPPAPSRFAEQADAVLALLPTMPASGGGEGLRAEVERLIEKPWALRDQRGQTVMAVPVRDLAMALHRTAALAARDTDQGAGAAVPLCPVCREPVELWADLHGEAQADCTACDWQTEVAL